MSFPDTSELAHGHVGARPRIRFFFEIGEFTELLHDIQNTFSVVVYVLWSEQCSAFSLELVLGHVINVLRLLARHRQQ
jgi:hypothetical protein